MPLTFTIIGDLYPGEERAKMQGLFSSVWGVAGLLGHSATSSGLTLMPMSFAWPLASTLVGRFMYRIRSKTTAVLGAMLIVAGSAWLLLVHTGSPYWYFVGVMIVISFGMGCSFTPLTVLVQSAVGWNLRGAATASNTFARSLGQTVGIAVFGTVFNNSLNQNGMAQGLHLVFILVFAISIITLLISAVLPSHSKVMKQQKAD